MFEGVVIGVDPGMAATGLAAVRSAGDGLEVLQARTIRTPADAGEPRRLWAIHDAVARAMAAMRPSAVAVERLMWGRNVGSAMSVSRATGVVLLASAQAGIAVHEYAPLEVKMAVAGNGTAAKADVRRSLARLHRVQGVPSEADAADAVAVAVCHMRQARMRAVAR